MHGYIFNGVNSAHNKNTDIYKMVLTVRTINTRIYIKWCVIYQGKRLLQVNSGHCNGCRKYNVCAAAAVPLPGRNHTEEENNGYVVFK
jgi:hypothetical protein